MTVVEETESLSHNESEEPPTKKMKKIITDDNVKEEEDNDTATSITLKNQKNSANSTTKEEDQEEHSDASAPANMAVVKKEEKKKRTTSTKKVTKVPFEERLKECIAFKKKHGHCKITTTGKNSTKSLGIWVQEMRRNFKLQMSTGKPRQRIPDGHIQQLTAIGFHWGYTPKAGLPQSDEAWTLAFEDVQEYYKTYHTFDIQPSSSSKTNKTNTDDDGSRTLGDYRLCFLAEWVCDQRNQKKRRDSKMKSNINKQRVDMLTTIGFNFDGPRTVQKNAAN